MQELAWMRVIEMKTILQNRYKFGKEVRISVKELKSDSRYNWNDAFRFF